MRRTSLSATPNSRASQRCDIPVSRHTSQRVAFSATCTGGTTRGRPFPARDGLGRAERGQIESEIEEHEKLIERNKSEMECAERRVDGKDCVGWIGRTGDYMARTTAGAVEKLSDVGDAAGRIVSSITERAKALSRTSRVVLDKLKSITADDVKDMVTRLTLILVLLAIENIVLPIIFLAIALKASVPIVSGLMRISTSINQDTREALSAMDKALPSRKG